MAEGGLAGDLRPPHPRLDAVHRSSKSSSASLIVLAIAGTIVSGVAVYRSTRQPQRGESGTGSQGAKPVSDSVRFSLDLRTRRQIANRRIAATPP